ncbi:hypothetical protein [Dictyobacter arantiisoli]|uniref:Uncharacterized protein n=1 Tax=Dictyobacter arantiisoli TaxID=2014874 RepID=A0A5A5TDN9_9CHLR|nr:hypothetical protein [Dictyobacter arantiisoli]GCF09163.1 hypothetical protein KDI_27270 [Dictyobacter arantiisoli]
MAAVELRVDLSTLIDAVVKGDNAEIISSARSLLEQERNADVLIGRVGILASQGDPEGHVSITLAAAAMLARFLRARPAPLDTEAPLQTRALPLFVRALSTAAPAIRKGKDAKLESPRPFFPSELLDQGKSVNQVLNDAIQQNDAALTERLLLGLYSTGADYRTLQVRAYEAVATTFANGGHPLMDTVRGFQLLDAVEWGKQVPQLLHWLAPQLPIQPNKPNAAWVQTVRDFVADSKHSIASVRTRLSAPKNANALPLQQVILSNAETGAVCQQVYDAIITGEATPLAVTAVAALAAAELLQSVGDADRDLFIRASHGLLFASAARNALRQVQDEELFTLVFTVAAYVNALYKEIAPLASKESTTASSAPAAAVGGGLIAVTQLETLEAQLKNKDIHGAYSTAQRYLKLGHDPRALFGTIGLVAAWNDTTLDQGHSLQIVQAAGEEFTSWGKDLSTTNIDVFLQLALRAAALGKRDTLIAQV